VIEAVRDNFENGQRKQIDVMCQYKQSLGSFWQGQFMRLAGYPKINFADFAIVSTDRADDAFKNHKEDGIIKLR
jgi:hypothetical protein